MTWIWSDTLTDTIIVTGINNGDVEGNSDTIIVIPRSFNYDLTTVSFPSSIRSKTWTTWEVTATRNGQPISSSEVQYRWFMTSDTTSDSIRTQGGKREMYIKNDKQFTLSVIGVIGIDSTYKKSVAVKVYSNRPTLSSK